MSNALQESVMRLASNSSTAANAQYVSLRPIDAWFFRDGRPYNAMETNQTDVISLFPPSATTLVGAIRAALARSQGWDGCSDWKNNDVISNVLGTGFDDLGAVTFRGPWLARRSHIAKSHERSDELLFPMPLHVLGKLRSKSFEEESLENIASSEDHARIWEPHCLLTPAREGSLCDLGEARLPVAGVRSSTFDDNKRGLKEPSGLWITQTGLQRILDGQLPTLSDIVAAERLWKHESRVGLIRCEAARTTKEGALYSPRYVRLQPDVSVVISITGLPNCWRVPELLPLGGEGRLAECRIDPSIVMPDFSHCQSDGYEAGRQRCQIAVVLLTPLLPEDYDKERGLVCVPKPGQSFFQTDGTNVISGCVGKTLSLGGWNTLERRPLDLRPVLPAGSTWFLEVEDMAAFAKSAANGFGLKTKYGFGQVALGVWPDRDERV